MISSYLQTPKKYYEKLIQIFCNGTIAFLTTGHVSSQCDYTVEMTDSWGDGWNGGIPIALL